MKLVGKYCEAACWCALLLLPAFLNAQGERHGGLGKTGLVNSLQISLTSTWQHVEKIQASDEPLSSLDIVATKSWGAAVLTLYLEGCTTPLSHGVAAAFAIPQVNGDAGTALDSSGHGRLQLSELHLAYPLGPGLLTLGMVDPSAFADVNSIANDETSQFLAAPLVNNPTIPFPDYTLGMVYRAEKLLGDLGINLMLLKTPGLGDGDCTYSTLLRFDDAQKAAFLIGELLEPLGSIEWTVGLWHSNARWYSYLRERWYDGIGGFYLVADGSFGRLRWSARLGVADDRVFTFPRFGSLAVEGNLGAGVWGAGLAYRGPSSDLQDLAKFSDTQISRPVLTEIYLRYPLAFDLEISPDVQLVRNPILPDGSQLADDYWVASIRIGYRLVDYNLK